ncbi:MAG: 50S ribosomal protein L30 [Candidatus Thorarchaeota archaeon]|nr:50S ribosomal protein L30 [Candidatus Thorarchaeota archaeon]
MSTTDSVIIAIRVRGQARVRPEIEDTLNKLLLGRVHQARILRLTPSLFGMVQRAKDYITWGEIDEETADLILTKRGRLPGNRRLTDEHVRKNSSFKSIKALAKAIVDGTASVSDVAGLKPVFRLTPPSGGYKGKHGLPVTAGGITGYRGAEINRLVRQMA